LKKTKESDSEEDMQLGFWQLLKSTLSAFLGVQSTANRERDFRHGKLSHFIWMGLLFGLAFVLTLIGVVQLVMHFASNQG
jgi:diacylglycerol kinase